MAEIRGSNDSETLNGTTENDKIWSRDGDDTVSSKEGDDWINAEYNEEGDDLYWVYSGSLIAFGGPGNDLIGGKEGEDQLYGESGDDRIHGWAGNDFIYGGNGEDFIYGGNGDDFIYGGNGDDIIYGGMGNDQLWGNEGNDRLYGGDGDDTYHITDLNDYVRDSSGNDTAKVYVSFAKIPAFIENIEYIGALPLPYWIDALLPANSNGSNFLNLLGNNRTFLYAFPSHFPSYISDMEYAGGFRQLSATQQQNAVMVLEYLEEIINIDAEKTDSPDQPNTVAIALNEQENTGGYAFYPGEESRDSDIFLADTRYNATLNHGTRGAYVLVHELGHALGLKHPFDEADADGNTADPPYLQGTEDHVRWTMMSYNETLEEYKLTFSELDIAALQYLYGPSRKSRTGDDTYFYRTDSPNFIWDGGGEDTVDASASHSAVAIYLEPGYQGFNYLTGKSEQITTPGQITVNFGTEIENLLGSADADLLVGNWLNNQIQGNDGDDRIFGQQGDDSLAGGTGDDELSGWTGSDVLNGGPGNDLLKGGQGLDHAIYASDKKDYIIEYNEGYITVVESGLPGGFEDRLEGIERLVFTDVSLAFDIDGNAGIAAKVLGAFLGAVGLERADLAGRLLDLLDSGMNYDDLLRTAIESVFGSNPGGGVMVTHFFTALTGDEAPDEIVAEWGGKVDNGELSALELSKLVAENQLNLTNIDFVGLYSTGIEYLTA